MRAAADQSAKAARVFNQIMDTRERIQGYLKADLAEVIYEKESLMPAFTAQRLNDNDLNDLVGYLVDECCMDAACGGKKVA